MSETHTKRSIEILRHYQKAAIDFSRRNRLLKYPTRATKIEFELSFEECRRHFGSIDDIAWIFDHKQIIKDEETGQALLFEIEQIEGLSAPKVFIDTKTSIKGKKLISTLEKLRLGGKKSFQEHGLHTLFMVFGEVCWKEHSDRLASGDVSKQHDFIAPLLLIPISLEIEKTPSKSTVLSIDTALHPIQFNPVLLLFIKQNFDLRLPSLPETPEEMANLRYEQLRDILQEFENIFEEKGISINLTERIYLGQFSFHGQQIYEDLCKNEEQFLQNEFVNTVCGGESILQDNSRLVDVDNEDFNPDSFLNNKEDFTILDADSSQIHAIKKIMSGDHMVIHGPPGTGKSQTIANVISNFLARNKKVLFVCEKQVALDVVYKRLSSENLNVADLCLPLFNYTNDRKSFASDLLASRRDAMDSVKKSRGVDLETTLRSRQIKIDQLKAYGEIITKQVAPLNKSLYWIFGELAKVKDHAKSIPISWKGKEPLNYDFDKYNYGELLIVEISGLIDLFNEQSQWNMVLRKHYSFDFSQRVIESLGKIKGCLDSLASKFDMAQFKDIYSIKAIISLLSLGENNAVFTDNNRISSISPFYLEDVKSAILQTNKSIEVFDSTFIPVGMYIFPEHWEILDELDIVVLETKTELNELFTSRTTSIIENLENLIKEIDVTIPNDILNLTIREFQHRIPLFQIDFYFVQLTEVSRSQLYDLKSFISRMESLTNLLHASDEMINKYGIDHQSIELNISIIIEGSFSDNYKTFFRALSNGYKNDKREISSWCSLRKPEKYVEYRNLAFGVASRKKIQLLLDEEWNKMIGTYSLDPIVRRLPLFKILNAVNTVLHYLEQSNLEYIEQSIQKHVCDKSMQALIVKKALVVDQILSGWSSMGKMISDDPSDLKVFELIDAIALLSVDVKETKNMFNLVSMYVDTNQLPESINDLNGEVAKLNQLKKVIVEVENLALHKYIEASSKDILLEKHIITDFNAHINGIDSFLVYLKPEFATRTPKDLKSFLSLIEGNREWVESVYDKIFKEADGLSGLFENAETLDSFMKSGFNDILEKVKAMIHDVEGLERWTSYQKGKANLEEINLGWFINDVARLSLPGYTDLKGIYNWSFFNKWIEDYSALQPIVLGFNKEKYSQIISEFKRLERETLEINRLRILNEYMPLLEESYEPCEAERKLRNEALKKIRHLPIRTLVQRYSDHIQLMKPCWMVSPLALSSYLEFGKVQFDVVIFDEASQMKIENALGAIARSKQVIVIGDEHQLPPSTFFSAGLEGDDDLDDLDEEIGFESILQKSISMLGSSEAYLKYHYRSSSEDLIAFSNHHIYKNRLITFPNRKDTKGVVFKLVKGVYDKGATRTNLIEAEEVAMTCIEHMQNVPGKTLGVIAFSRAQEQAIRDALNEKLKEYEHLSEYLDESSDKKESFFIKNLESVQGDERDVIVLSICYGLDKLGAPPSSFGPIGYASGYRRLNVAITRAKDQLICVSSIRYNEMRASANKGVLLLQKYLEYAEKGWHVLEANLLNTNSALVDHDSAFEACVEEALVENGYKICRQVGVSGFKIDLAIVNPKNHGEFLLGIECDGAAYHSSKSARIRDRMRQDILESRGWKIYRIWSQHWYGNKDAIIQDIIRHVNSLL